MAIDYRSQIKNPAARECSVRLCGRTATLLHQRKPYCGKHALDLAEAGEPFERQADYLRSRPSEQAITDENQHSRG